MKTVKLPFTKLFTMLVDAIKIDFINNITIKKYYAKSNAPPVTDSKILIFMAEGRNSPARFS
jgi:hypothetical protein